MEFESSFHYLTTNAAFGKIFNLFGASVYLPIRWKFLSLSEDCIVIRVQWDKVYKDPSEVSGTWHVFNKKYIVVITVVISFWNLFPLEKHFLSY